ncbi:hypothetical protein HMPREF9418_0877 [Neisseria macacae ATCC 33926]|uniref:Uncharacterized protein n=1 Tax=Neisseria macacae ATCC 33926 TaxID=997348 RepID=A0AA36UK70_9NEIS|nr:hypothetical protein HMPREF9418_0877 [Neisseria macacae ATCC 33926]
MWKCCWQQKRSSENIPSYRKHVFRRPLVVWEAIVVLHAAVAF